ncbi:MAG TPA: DNA alkylation repair protein [Candidatus Alistipes intestinigallinarum]|uniref:DNA alkylation repair protein n=1 Tax=Candidatus Alistipes intestinigallinarum TaxID=2838440 RepID=A0A9D2CBC5_9BACT|nr:DNA alkylation repair protein [Candidatus Alistipes intestinigallinarum]
MDLTSRMTALLGAFRRERNGAVADSMRFYGRPYGLNYGVSLPTLRRLARAEGTDHDFARYLYRQDVRELRLAAFHIADPGRLTPEESAFWGDGLLNSEMAEEGAFALLSRAASLPTLFEQWTEAGSAPLRQYAALMAAGRAADPQTAWIPRIVETLRRAAEQGIPESRLLAQGAVAALAAIGSRNEENRQTVLRAAGSLGSLPAEDFVHEELAWRLELPV